MKRQSAAEVALAKQSRHLEKMIDDLLVEQEKTHARINTIKEVKAFIDKQIDALYLARKQASESRK